MLQPCNDVSDEKSIETVAFDLNQNTEGHNYFEGLTSSSKDCSNDLNIGNSDHYHPEIRLINIQKDLKHTNDFCGFNLSRSKWDPYPWVSAVDKNSLAYNAGLKVGDCILEVNGEDVLGRRISEIAKFIKKKPNSLSLLLWSTGRDPKCDENSLCCGPMPLSLERLSASMQTILACLECPVCMDIVPAPVTQCQNGHILCIKCRSKSDKCPICRQHYSCVRSLIAEQIYSAISDAFKLQNGNDKLLCDGNHDDDNDIHMNNIRSSGRKLREKLFGAKYKKRQNQYHQQQQQQQKQQARQQQSVLFDTKNFKSTTKLNTTMAALQLDSTAVIKNNSKSASTICINDDTTTSCISKLNNDEITLNRENKRHHHGSGNLFNHFGNGILTPTNRFLAKILGKAQSLENLSNRNSHLNTIMPNDSNNKNCNNTDIILDDLCGKFDNEKLPKKKISENPQQLLSKECFGNNLLLPPPEYKKFKKVKQFSQSTNDLSSSASSSSQLLFPNKFHHNIYSQDNNNPMVISIPRCPSLNPIPTTATATTTVSSSLLSSRCQFGSLKGLNFYNSNNNTIGYTDDISGNCNASECGIIMNSLSLKPYSNISLSINNLHDIVSNNVSSITTGLKLHKRPSAVSLSSSVLSLMENATTAAAAETAAPSQPLSLNGVRATESVENVDFTETDNTDVNQCLTLTVPKINQIKSDYSMDIIQYDSTKEADNTSTDCNNTDGDYNGKKIKVVKLLDNVGRFLCPYDCCDDKFNVSSLNHHIKVFHSVPIISFGTSNAEIALPLRKPMDSSIIELNLNKNIFWIKIDIIENESILVTALFQGTEDESSAFILEGKLLQNRVDDKLLQEQHLIIIRSMICSMMKSSWNNISKNCNFISKKLLVSEIYMKTAPSRETATATMTETTSENIASIESILGIKSSNEVEKHNNNIAEEEDNNIRIQTFDIETNNSTAMLDEDEAVVTVDNINKVIVVTDELNTSQNYCNNCNSNLNEKDFNLKNSVIDDDNDDDNDDVKDIDCNKNKNNYIDNSSDKSCSFVDDRKQLKSLFFHHSIISSTFNNYYNNINNKEIDELLLKICVKYK